MLITAILLGLFVQDPTTEGKEVKTVDEWFHKTTLVKKKECLRISGEKKWKEFWAEHTGKKDKPEKVDFTKNMVVVFAMETYWGCLQPEVTESGVRETKKAIRVIADLKPGGCDNNMHGHPLGLSKSILIVVVPKSKKKIDFVLTTVTGGKKVGPKIVQTIPE